MEIELHNYTSIIKNQLRLYKNKILASKQNLANLVTSQMSDTKTRFQRHLDHP